MRYRKYAGQAAAIGLIASLAACGDSDTPPTAATPSPPPVAAPGPAPAPSPAPVASDSVPPSAVASPSAFVSYLRSLAPDDSGKPLRVDVTPPVDDAGEPSPLS